MSAPNQWLELYNNPDPGIISKLNSHDFKSFIAYVFERAGYQVAPYHPAGADLELFDGRFTAGFVAATVGVQQVGPNPVLALGGVPADDKSEKFFISAEDFSPQVLPAIKNSNENRKPICLINSGKLQRFITYVRGTRHPKSRNTPLSPAKLFEHEPQKRLTTRTKVLVLANNKGGVCKTTSALAIGLILATEKKKKVLFVDLDDQSNLTQAAMRSKKFQSPNISDHFADYSSYPLGSLIQSTRFNNAWIIPSAPDLRLTLSTTVDWTESEQRFTNFLHHDSVVIPNGGGDFDWIIIDTPPALSLYTRSALIASHYVLTPYTPSALDERGLQNLLETLNEIRGIASAGNQTRMLGCFATRWKRTSVARADIEKMKAAATQGHAPLLETDIAEDPSNIRKVVSTEGTSSLSSIHGALDDYRTLVKEIQGYVGDN